MVQSASSSSAAAAAAAPCCTIDRIGNECSVQGITRTRRKRQQQVGHAIARKRLLANAAQAPPTGMSPAKSKTTMNNGVLAYHGPGRGDDIYMTGESPQYSNCAFLDGHDVILAASIHGDVDVLRLPRYRSGGGGTEITKLAGRLRLSGDDNNNASGYSVAARYKLKSLQNGHAFCVGTPSGRLNIFSTEHASTWGRDALPRDWSRRLHQEPLHRSSSSSGNNHQNNSSNSPWLPFITHNWQTDALQTQIHGTMESRSYLLPHRHGDDDVADSVSPLDWWIQPKNDCLWDFREISPSALLSAHAKQDYSGCARQLGILDSRTFQASGTVLTVDLNNSKTRRPEGITAICFASDQSLVTAHARPALAYRNIDNVIQIWDLRKFDAAVLETPVLDPSIPQDSTVFGKHFISCLTPSTASSGQVMVTSSSHQNHSTVQHFWFDLSRHQPIIPVRGHNKHKDVEASYVQQRNRNTTVFATNPAQCFMACYDNSPGRDGAVRLFDLSKSGSSDSQQSLTTTGGISSSSSRPTISRKRSYDEQENDTTNNLATNTINRANEGPASGASSSDDEDDDDSIRSESDGELSTSPYQYRGIKCTGSFRPKLCDRYGLSTQLSCLAVNDSGSAIIGGSHDGDVFAWRGL